MRAQDYFSVRDRLLNNLTSQNFDDTVSQFVQLRTMIPLQIEQTLNGNPNLYILVRVIEYGSHCRNQERHQLFLDLLSKLIERDVFLSEINYPCRISHTKYNMTPIEYAGYLRFKKAKMILQPSGLQEESRSEENTALKAENARLRKIIERRPSKTDVSQQTEQDVKPGSGWELVPLKLMESENKKLKSENEKLKSENEKLKSENEKLKESHAAANATIAQLTSQLSFLQRPAGFYPYPFQGFFYHPELYQPTVTVGAKPMVPPEASVRRRV